MTKEEEKNERERLHALKVLKSSYEMYERTKNEAIKIRNNKTDKNGDPIYSKESTDNTIELMDTMEQDIIQKYLDYGGDINDLKEMKIEKTSKKNTRKALEEIMERKNKQAEMLKELSSIKFDNLSKLPEKEDNNEVKEEIKQEKEFDAKKDYIIPQPVTTSDVVEKFEYKEYKPASGGNKIQYDVIPLPSKGECYKKKFTKIPVGYLTAFDENLIVSPNLYRDGNFLDVLLKSKVMDNTIDTDDLLPGDRDAIILWLRASGYGPEYPVNATDPNTGIKFDGIVDLTEVKFKKFELKGDENGYFDFKLPYSGDEVKFKFLSFKDNNELSKEEEIENERTKKDKLISISDTLSDYVDDDTKTDNAILSRIKEATKAISEYADSIKYDEQYIPHIVTNKLAKCIMSINGITDREYIKEYVDYMNVRDSSALRKYIVKNEPGLDFNVKVKKPESLGGGSIDVFLALDEYLFFNTTD